MQPHEFEKILTFKTRDILNVEKLIQHISKFIELKLEIYELKLKEQLVDIISSFATMVLIIGFGMLMLFFGSLALGFFLNSVFDSEFLGFVCVGAIYMLICILLFAFKHKIITNQLFQAFFSETLTRSNDEQEEKQSN